MSTPHDGGPAGRVAVVGGGVTGLTCALELARAGTVVHRTAEPDLWWAPGVPGHRFGHARRATPATNWGTRCTLPVIDTSR